MGLKTKGVPIGRLFQEDMEGIVVGWAAELGAERVCVPGVWINIRSLETMLVSRSKMVCSGL